MVPKCGSLLRTQENHEKVAEGLATKISPTLSQCQTTRKLWNSRQDKKNWGSKYGSMLISYENHGKVGEIGHGTNQCHFPMNIKKADNLAACYEIAATNFTLVRLPFRTRFGLSCLLLSPVYLPLKNISTGLIHTHICVWLGYMGGPALLKEINEL